MSPVDQSRNHVGRAASVALVGVLVLAIALGLVTLALGGRNSSDLAIGDQTFQAGNAEKKAELIAKDGPVIYADVSGRKDRDVILQHTGTDPTEGWHAFLAAPIEKSRDCTWVWQADEELFRAKCDQDLTAPADGKGLPQFPVKVVDGQLDVDLNADAREAASTTTTRRRAGTPSWRRPSTRPGTARGSGRPTRSCSGPSATHRSPHRPMARASPSSR